MQCFKLTIKLSEMSECMFIARHVSYHYDASSVSRFSLTHNHTCKVVKVYLKQTEIPTYKTWNIYITNERKHLTGRKNAGKGYDHINATHADLLFRLTQVCLCVLSKVSQFLKVQFSCHWVLGDWLIMIFINRSMIVSIKTMVWTVLPQNMSKSKMTLKIVSKMVKLIVNRWKIC